MCLFSADVNAVDMYGVTAIHLAAENGHVLCLRALINAGAACNASTAEKRPQWVTTTGSLLSIAGLEKGFEKTYVFRLKNLLKNLKSPKFRFF